MTQRFQEWQPIRLYGEGVQPHTGRHWNCLPAWDVTAVYPEPDAVIRHPDAVRAESDPDGEYPNKNRTRGVFWNRHIDRRFHLEYPRAAKSYPRAQGRTIGDPDREWDTLIEYRDRYLAEAGLTLEGDPEAVARVMAESFACENFEKKPMCETFEKNQRELCHAMEGLMHKSFCVGCAEACIALADACGFPARGIGCGAHRVAEIRVNGRWHMADSVGRHEKSRGLACWFESSYHDMFLDPMGDHGERIFDGFRDGLFRRPNPQFHFNSGMWSGPCTLRWATSCACAIYPDNERWGFKSEDNRRLPIVARSGGFYWPQVHSSDKPALRQLRRAALPHAMYEGDTQRDYLFHPFLFGQALRQSVWLDALDDMEAMELTFTFGASSAGDFSDATGRQLALRIGDFEKSLADLDAWPPQPAESKGPENTAGGATLASTVTVPADAFRPKAVNWIELHQKSNTLLYSPCVPAVMEPYIAPLRSESEDAFRPPRA